MAYIAIPVFGLWLKSVIREQLEASDIFNKIREVNQCIDSVISNMDNIDVCNPICPTCGSDIECSSCPNETENVESS
jgi:hypothetical protein